MSDMTQLASAIRVLAMDAIEKAKSGHPGAPMGMADIAAVLWGSGHFKHNPADPCWPDRDRFVLSNGHGSMLLYAVLHLTGYDLSVDDLMNFRQLGSKTPGHPECKVTPGVETSTGPLGQGVANAVGMALAERTLAATFNRPGHEIVDHHTWVFMGDGCMMEGLSHEACSLAGTLGLGKLIAFYDDNGISIDGHVVEWFDEDVPARFRAYGWKVIADVDGHDFASIDAAIAQAKGSSDKPTLICCKTVIGKGAPTKCGSHDCHGAPLGSAEIASARESMGWAHEPFVIPDPVKTVADARLRGATLQKGWEDRFAAYKAAFPELAAEFLRRMSGELPESFAATAATLVAEAQAAGETVATRKASQKALNLFGPLLPEMFGGSADLTSSNLTNWSGSKKVTKTVGEGNYLSFGVREFAMSAMLNGMALHGGFIPYGGTFLVFSDYSRNAMRMAALMGIRVVNVLTHDSIGVGEDGPTHQPVEHVTALRIIPNMQVWRPCDVPETVAAWAAALKRVDGPTSLILSRQNLPHQERTPAQLENVARGGYVLKAASGTPDVVLLASGSEVDVAQSAAALLEAEGLKVQVSSMPCLEAFAAQDDGYRATVLGSALTPKVAVEAGVTMPWHRWVGAYGEILGIDRFGESAPGGVLFKHFGFTAENVVALAKRAMEKSKG